MTLTEIVQSSGWKNFMAKLYGLGASVVIIGALFKIQHWAGAGIMLTVGLTTEAIIFFFSAFEPLHEELDWTLVYPELAGITDPEEIEFQDNNQIEKSGSGTGMLERFDEIMGQADISPEVFTRLGEGLNKLNQTARNMSDISEASVATNEYVSNFRNAAESLSSMTTNYARSTETLNSSVNNLSQVYERTADVVNQSGQKITEQVQQSGESLAGTYKQLTDSVSNYADNINEGSKSYGGQLESLSRNLAALNAVYELQLQGTNEHLKENERIYGALGQMMENLKESVDDTKKYREEISRLGENLSALNNIYGNMLSAMSVVSKK